MQKSEILNYDEYARIEAAGFPAQYIVEAGRHGQNLLFYGSEHTKDPSHPQFHGIEHRWQAFVSKSISPVALVEGHNDEIPTEQTAERISSIVAGGESGFVVHLARRDGVPVYSPEPDRLEEANSLANEFGRDKVLLYYYVRQLGEWLADTNKPDIEAESTKMLGLMQQTFNWQDVDFGIGGMHKLHEQVLQKPLVHDRKWLYDLTTPATLDYVTNELARRSGELRDKHIFKEIKKQWLQGNSPFIIFGSAHAICLEPALKSLG